ncbi:MAG: exo-alpha-sialidase [Acidobacteria bacterium]|nr:exo-alpha-sialidase [Acidobacteriota bacterium]
MFAWLRYRLGWFFFLSLIPLVSGAPYRLNRTRDSALPLYPDNQISAAQDAQGNLHLAYTDGDAQSRWQIYYRSLKNGSWGIPIKLSEEAGNVADRRSPQLVFDPATQRLYATWIGLSGGSGGGRNYQLFVEKIDPANGSHMRVGAFNFGTANFQPRIALAPGHIFLLSEERPTKTRAVFHIRVLVTATGAWVERQLESTPILGVTSPAIAATQDQGMLFWVESSADGYDVVGSKIVASETAWSETKRIFRSSTPPEALSASAHGKMVSLVWSLRSGGDNSILLHTLSYDAGSSWRNPEVLYSVDATARATMTVLSDNEIMALLHIYHAQGERIGEKIKMKYSVDAGKTWIPKGEIEALDLGPGKGASEARRPSLAVLDRRGLLLAWEEWKSGGPTLVFKRGQLQGFANAPTRSPVRELPNRFSYYPQVWTAGEKIYMTYGNKRRPISVTENIPTSDLYITELIVLPATRSPGGSTKKEKR